MKPCRSDDNVELNLSLLTLTLRFPSDLPDLRLPTIQSPATTTALSLLPRIRNNLPASNAKQQILLISGGRIVPLKEPLTTSLRLPTSRKLGKARAEDDVQTEDGLNWIIHATFSGAETLSEQELEDEAREGEELNAKLIAAQTSLAATHGGISGSIAEDAGQSRLPQGFDRLSSAGIPETEISTLRTQFRVLLAASRPGEAPLTPMELLTLEERWLDDGAAVSGADGLTTSFDASQAQAQGVQSLSQTDDLLWGNILGFFWPLGSLFWMSRQDGIWREQRGLAVFVGVLINLAFCAIRSALAGAGA